MNENLVQALASVEEGRVFEKALNENNEKCEKLREYCLQALTDLKETVVDVLDILESTPELTIGQKFDSRNGEEAVRIGRDWPGSAPRFGYIKAGRKIYAPQMDCHNAIEALGVRQDESQYLIITPGSVEDEIYSIKSLSLPLSEWTKLQRKAEVTQTVTLILVKAVKEQAESYATTQKVKHMNSMKACSKTYKKVGTRKES